MCWHADGSGLTNLFCPSGGLSPSHIHQSVELAAFNPLDWPCEPADTTKLVAAAIWSPPEKIHSTSLFARCTMHQFSTKQFAQDGKLGAETKVTKNALN